MAAANAPKNPMVTATYICHSSGITNGSSGTSLSCSSRCLLNIPLSERKRAPVSVTFETVELKAVEFAAVMFEKVSFATTFEAAS
eukprot:CAMPEP_0194038750 /NCGR_PEP_ID=MMETSP0009_2-20130614/10971_1 /TAXON_ID=210454 /ORGANISM="Grammatophora oceanica, Strain CCMP 410" /LENGTH=84 /DNA_ID=CAMNT_0038681361 /DNA_START=11 /DNA_END=262 /DNA_ORIENTATION=-